jgi:radical SAM superfamily enzyme YgiQ (UPF0313 family)
MGLKALLVYPEMPPTYWSFRYALPFIGRKASLPPLGLLTVAALLPEDWDTTLVDMNVEPLTEVAVAAADIVFTSSMLVQKDSLDDVIRLCRRHGTQIVAGGPYPTASYEHIGGVDYFVLNEAEVTLPRFLADLERDRAEHVYLDATKPDIVRSPPPRFDLLRSQAYSSMALQFSRGCPHQCEFCDVIELFGRLPRTKTPSQFLGELELLYRQGWEGSLFVVDDNFIGNKKEVKVLLPEIARWQRDRRYPFTFFTEATLGLAEDDALMDQMVEAGFNMVFLGLETPDPCTLAAVGKAQNLRSDMLAAVHRIQAKGMEVAGGFILGFDSDPEDIFDRQIDFIQNAGIPTAMVGLLNALPKTRLGRRLAEEGRLKGEPAGNNTHDFRLNFIPKMDVHKLLAGYKRVLAEIYRPDNYFDRCIDLLKNLKTHQTSHRRIKAAELRAFVLSLLRQTFSSYSWSYWKFLVRGFLAKPSMVAETVTMAVKGHHFFKMTKNVLEVDRFKQALEKLAKTFEQRVREVSAQDVKDRIAELRDYRDRVVARMQVRYRRLHADFRIYAEDAVASFQTTLDELIDGFAAGLSTTATA